MSDEIPYRWTAQDVAAVPKIANPYGINPGEVFKATDDPPPNDKRWASRFEDGEEVNLPLRACRVTSMLTPFTVSGYKWIELPPEIQAPTIGALCQKLADLAPLFDYFTDFSSKAPKPETDAVAERKRQIARKLFCYWKNTHYRWAVLHSGQSPTTIDRAPETLPTAATGTRADGKVRVSGALRWVLVRDAVQNASGAPPNKPDNDDEHKVLTIVVKKAPQRVPLPPPKKFEGLRPELVDTLGRSFVDRLLGSPLAEANLMYGFRRDESAPQTLWEALENLGPSAVNFLVRMFKRMEGIDGSLTLWRQVKYIRNQWWGGSAGMKVVYRSPKDMRACLDGLLKPDARPTVARDKYLGSLEHQNGASVWLAPGGLNRLQESKLNESDQEPPDCNTWREVDKLADEAMHFCVDKADLHNEQTRRLAAVHQIDAEDMERTPSHDDIHIDWVSPVSGIEPGRNLCKYAPDISIGHWFQAMVGLGQPAFHFDIVRSNIELTQRASQRSAKASELADFQKRWDKVEWSFAVEGRSGHEKARPYAEESTRLMMASLPAVSPGPGRE